MFLKLSNKEKQPKGPGILQFPRSGPSRAALKVYSAAEVQVLGFIRHILHYTEYNQQWNVSQVLLMDSAIICNTTQDNIHKFR